MLAHDENSVVIIAALQYPPPHFLRMFLLSCTAQRPVGDAQQIINVSMFVTGANGNTVPQSSLSLGFCEMDELFMLNGNCSHPLLHSHCHSLCFRD